MNYNIDKIFGCFNTSEKIHKWRPFGNGHIHDTFMIETLGKDRDDYLLQRINNDIFKNIPELQENIERVTKHLAKKISEIPGSNVKRECLNLIPSHSGKSWINDESGNYWRMFIFISNHKSYDVVKSPDIAFEGGKAIGRFQAILADIPGKSLHETIPLFHNIEARLNSFKLITANDPAGRVASAYNEINEILVRTEKMKVIMRSGSKGLIPLRITHNDTKFNNILLDENDKALCVIDLDTVMPGYVHYDFGDAIRTCANTAHEDEKDLSLINLDINLYKAFSEGYLNETRKILNTTEKEFLAFSPLLITYTIAVRFLTDYIDGDKYFKIEHDLHNLQRTKAQLRLLAKMEEEYEYMKDIIHKLV